MKLLYLRLVWESWLYTAERHVNPMITLSVDVNKVIVLKKTPKLL